MSATGDSPGSGQASVASGYIEGYYGRLLCWSEREQLLRHLASLGMTHYFYAPKEDSRHRFEWRKPYSGQWRHEYAQCCRLAAGLGITVVAGIAPGLDFDFAHLDSASQEAGGDFDILLRKARQLLDDGAGVIALLMDDIDEDFAGRAGAFDSEGQAHAYLANRLGEALGCELWVVPRAYADNIAAQSPDYLPPFLRTLASHHTLLYCGEHIIARQVSAQSLQASVGSAFKLVLWDNLYANDYCPRRLFLGPFKGREHGLSILLNPTGMPATDCFLLTVMGNTLQSAEVQQAWFEALHAHGVPDEFLLLAPYLDLPDFAESGGTDDAAATAQQFSALETLLWKWKTPLSREWYPWLLALKQDLQLAGGELSPGRVRKTQTAPLASVLLRRD